MIELYPETILISHFIHVQPIHTNSLNGLCSGLEIFSKDKNIAYHHSIDLFDFILSFQFGKESPLDFGEVVGLSIIVTPSVLVKTSVVIVKELGVRSDPFVELLEGKAE